MSKYVAEIFVYNIRNRSWLLILFVINLEFITSRRGAPFIYNDVYVIPHFFCIGRVSKNFIIV